MMSSIVLAAAYLIGAIPFAWIAGRAFFGIDLRKAGSGNIGATNLARVAPKPWGPVAAALALLLDAGKGAAAAIGAQPLESILSAEPAAAWLPAAAAACAILGHSFSAFLRFRGGKSVAVSAGAFLALMPAAAGCALGVWALVFAATRIVSLSSIVATAALPVAYALLPAAPGGRTGALAALAIAASVLVAWRHRSNLVRLFAGTENRLSLDRRERNTGEGPPRGPENP